MLCSTKKTLGLDEIYALYGNGQTTFGDKIIEILSNSKLILHEKIIIPDDIYAIRSSVSNYIINKEIDVVIASGGTGITGRDGTPEAIKVLLDKEIEGFGELFRSISFDKIKTSSLQTRALAGVANSTFIFVLPGSVDACSTAWNDIIQHQLNSETKPCNLVMLMPRLKE